MKNPIKIVFTFIFVLSLIFTSCETDIATNESLEEEITSEQPETIEINYRGSNVTATKYKGDHYLIDDSDILIKVDNGIIAKGTLTNDGGLWPNNIVYYSFDGLSTANQNRMKEAFAHWEARTQFTFVARTNQSNYISINDDSSSCSSNIGMIGGEQIMNIGGCSLTGSIIHEIGHAVGLQHEHQRSDRDDYITVSTNTGGYGILDGEVYGPFDFDSIMIYSSSIYMRTLSGGTWSAQRDMLSVHDVRAIEHYYNDNSPTIAMMGNNGKYVTSMNGNDPIICDRTSIQSWEKFKLVSLSNGKVALQGSNGKYVSSENGKKSMTCNRTSISAWEQFELIMSTDNTFSLKGNNGQYVSSLNGASPLICNRTTIASWEKFTMSSQD